MEERFFKVKKEHYIYKNYFEWLEFGKNISKVFEELKKKVGLETNNFSPSERLFIIPTEKDLLKFDKDLSKKEYPSGLRSFKKTSTVQKEWEKLLKENNIKILHKPNIVWDFNYGVGRFRTKLFHYKDDLYCSIETEHLSKEVPEGYEEIKGSTFYKIIEQIKEGEK